MRRYRIDGIMIFSEQYVHTCASLRNALANPFDAEPCALAGGAVEHFVWDVFQYQPLGIQYPNNGVLISNLDPSVVKQCC